MAISPKMGFQIGSSLISTGAALFGGGGGGDTGYGAAAGTLAATQAVQQSSIDMQANLYEDQAVLAEQEADAAAQQKAREVKQFREQQALGYSGGGVLLEGTPMKVLNDTRAQGLLEIQAIERRGAAQANMYRMQSTIMQNEGRAQMLAQTMQFNSEQAKAQMAMSATRAGGIQTALAGLGNMFGNAGLGGAKAQPTNQTQIGSAPGSYFQDPFAQGLGAIGGGSASGNFYQPFGSRYQTMDYRAADDPYSDLYRVLHGS